MPKEISDFDPERYTNPHAYYELQRKVGEWSIGLPTDNWDELELIQRACQEQGRRVGMIILNRKELGADGQPIIELYPIFHETVVSVIDDFIFDAGFEVEERHVREVQEALDKLEIEFEDEDYRREIIYQLALNAAENDLTGNADMEYMPRVFEAGLTIRAQAWRLEDGTLKRTYDVVESTGWEGGSFPDEQA